MRIHVLSDLHIEMAPFEVPETDADVLVLAGDIGVGAGGLTFAAEQAKNRHVIYVAGNHEFYGSYFPVLLDGLKGAAEMTGVHVLEDDEVIIDGVRFLGCTLWTDFELYGVGKAPGAIRLAEHALADYTHIRRRPQGPKLRGIETRRWHKKSRRFLEDALARPFEGPTVVVTHHGPHVESSPPRFLGTPLSPAFVSDLEDIIDGDRVDLWVHGHTHWCVDYEVNGTRIIANQRGYPHEPVRGFVPDLVVDVS